ncbi:MAG: hypothetical protein GXO99_02225 [Nitrospirae bacterium]|nr:hypothetical protein [Nitrospirota bacterium]
MKGRIKIIKSSGKEEDFNPDKLYNSLIRSGASPEIAQTVMEEILPNISHYTKTREIYRLAYRRLKRLNHASGMRYSLKKALFKLGPSGYPFEQYFAELLKAYGYSTKVGQLIKGQCIQHEVDIVAVNKDTVLVVECKYHNSAGRATNSKDALYVDSRFRDLEPVFRKKYPDRDYSGWLVTNTRFSTDAIQYARCAGYRLTSWRYPEKGGLEKMIEAKRLYPVTILSGIKANLASHLIRQGIILLKDLTEMTVDEIMRVLDLPKKIATTIKWQADNLCLCNHNSK